MLQSPPSPTIEKHVSQAYYPVISSPDAPMEIWIWSLLLLLMYVVRLCVKILF